MSSKFQKLITLFILSYALGFNIITAQTNKVTFQDKTFEKQGDKWFIKSSTGEFIYPVKTNSMSVILKEGVLLEMLEQLNEKFNVQIVQQNKLGIIDLQLPEGSLFYELADKYDESGYFEVIEINTYGFPLGEDPGFSSQQYLSSDYSGIIPTIDADDIWAYEDGSTDPVTVAVIDQGVDYEHDDLNMISGYGYDFIDIPDYDGPLPDQDSDHGTWVAGIIAAETWNSTAVAGVAGGYNGTPGAKIMSLRVMEWNPNLYPSGGDEVNASIVDDAIIYAADNGAKIINMSFEMNESVAVSNAIKYAYKQKGCLLVAASGNGSPTQAIKFPASHSLVLAVGGIELDYSNYGNANGTLSVVAPVSYITSTVNTTPGNSAPYATLSDGGTSSASPMVAATAALLWSNKDNLLQRDIKFMIEYYADRTFGYYNQSEYGNGLLSTYNTVGLGVIDPIEAPQIAVNAPLGGHPTISWSKVEDGYNYLVIKAGDDGRYNFIDKATITYVQGQNTYSWTDNNVTVNRFGPLKYYYRVISLAGDEQSASSNEVFVLSNSAESILESTETVSVTRFNLGQNYPNPFNPVTTISYSLARAGFVELAVYDVNGRVVKELQNGFLEQGDYSINFDASHLSSGVYYYNLKAAGFNTVKKMLLVR